MLHFGIWGAENTARRKPVLEKWKKREETHVQQHTALKDRERAVPARLKHVIKRLSTLSCVCVCAIAPSFIFSPFGTALSRNTTLQLCPGRRDMPHGSPSLLSQSTWRSRPI